MSRNRFSSNNLSIPELIGFGLGIIVITSLIIAFQAWLLALVLSWFGIIFVNTRMQIVCNVWLLMATM